MSKEPEAAPHEPDMVARGSEHRRARREDQPDGPSIAINATAEERKTLYGGFESMEQGFTRTWDQLTEYLASAGKEREA
jgi:hypothetical protein